MQRFAKDTPALYALIAGIVMGVFALDLEVYKGIVVWVLYFVPLTLALFGSRPNAPLVLGVVVAALTIIAYFASPEPPHGAMVLAGQIDRSSGSALLVAFGLFGRRLVGTRVRLEIQQWVKEGQAELSKRMRGEQQAGELARNILASLAQYVGAEVGSVHVGDRGGGYAWVGGYGLDAPPSEQHAVVRPGQTLVGQAALSRGLVVVDDVPDGYLEVRSGVGAAKPRTLVFLPSRAEEIVTGVVELGFFRPPPPSTLELLSSLSEAIGFSIRSMQYRERQTELLEETQRQAEELHAQQKELAASNEELSSQQEELLQANETLASQARLLESQKDSLVGAETVLRHKAAELERTSRYKSEFLANMSHELRTPLNSSLILAKLLADNREGNLNPEEVKYAQSIYGAGNDLLALINDILDLSKIEAGKVQLHVEQVAVARIARDLRVRFEPLAAEKNLALAIDIAPGCPETLHTDLQRVQQILTNLLSNAVKFTERGSIRLRVEPSDSMGLAFAVEDTGIGIPADKHEVIFEAFRQADGTTSRKFGGTGLGLSICRELAALLEGEIRIRSAPNEGSVFTLHVPLRTSAAVAMERTTQPRGATQPPARTTPPEAARPFIDDDRATVTNSRRVILIVEDDPAFAQILRDLARELDFQCIAAGSADEALRLAREHRPAAVVLDIGLPDHSGLTVLELLKRDPLTRHVPIHVISVHDYQQVALEMGAVGYALKPVKREEIVSAFRILEERLSRRMKSLLIVEDDGVQRHAIAKLLGGDDVRIVASATSDEALVHLRNTTFDCVVLDLMLPDIDGFELLERMSADTSCSFPPVIVYTARALDLDEEHKLRLLSRSIIVKGARSPERLLEEVTLFLHQVESELPPDKQRMLRLALDREVIFEGRRILLVEDDVRSVFALTSMLQTKGATVDIARNGKEALAKLEAGPAIDLVLMDVMMPEMNGLEATRAIRKSDTLGSVPIIALTAKAMPDDREECLAAGANDYIAKPIDGEKLLSLLRVWMPK